MARTVALTAKRTADIIARDVVVYGYVKGNIRAKGRIEIKKNGSVIRNLTTAQIMIEDGANFKGSIDIDKSTAKESDKNVSSRRRRRRLARDRKAFSDATPLVCLHRR